MSNFNLGTQEFDGKEVINRLHPPVIRVMDCVVNEGEHPRGCIVANNGTGIMKYDPLDTGLLAVPVGVLVDVCRSSEGDTTAKVLVHGTVNKYALVVGESGEPDTDDLNKLYDIGIWDMDDGGL